LPDAESADQSQLRRCKLAWLLSGDLEMSVKSPVEAPAPAAIASPGETSYDEAYGHDVFHISQKRGYGFAAGQIPHTVRVPGPQAVRT
jgi:hypothetical protein